MVLIFHKFFKRIDKEEHFPTCFMQLAFNLYINAQWEQYEKKKLQASFTQGKNAKILNIKNLLNIIKTSNI